MQSMVPKLHCEMYAAGAYISPPEISGGNLRVLALTAPADGSTFAVEEDLLN